MSRVEIAEQFNVDAAACSNSRPIKIERHPESISSMRINNWSQFCDSVDAALAPLAKIKLLAKVTVVLFYIAVLVVLGFVVPRIYADFDEGLFRYFLVVYFPIALIYGIVYYYVRKNLASAMEKVKGACEQHSTSRVCYRLKSEHWGGCNKPYVKRWYIIVEENTASDDIDVEVGQQNTAAVDVSTYFSNSDEQKNSLHNPDATTALADMLK